MDNVTIDMISDMTDCCCIGARSRLPPPQISRSSTMNSRSSFGDGGATSNLSRSIGNIADIDAKRNEAEGGGQRGEEGKGDSVSRGGGQCSLPPTKTESNSSANNNCGGLQIGSHITQQPQSFSASSSTVDTGNVVFGASSFAPVVHTVSVSRQIAQWTKHQTLKLQVVIINMQSTIFNGIIFLVRHQTNSCTQKFSFKFFFINRIFKKILVLYYFFTLFYVVHTSNM